jgi:hypothetical protein
MEFCVRIRPVVRRLLQTGHEDVTRALDKYDVDDEVYQKGTVTKRALLHDLCRLLCNPSLTLTVGRACRPFLLLLISLITDVSSPTSPSKRDVHEVLSLLLLLDPNAVPYVCCTRLPGVH